jgi:hypothetical protein
VELTKSAELARLAKVARLVKSARSANLTTLAFGELVELTISMESIQLAGLARFEALAGLIT